MNQMAADLFISHRTLDDDVAERLAARLERETFDGTPEGRPLRAVYDHRDLRPGDLWSWWILEQARQARYMAVLVCPEITESEYAMAEFLNHLHVRQDCLIPLWVRDQRAADKPVEKIPPLFRNINYLDFRTAADFEPSFAHLLEKVRSVSASENPKPPDGPDEGGKKEEERTFSEAFDTLKRQLCIVEASPNGHRPLGLAWVESHSYVALPRRQAEEGAEIVWVRQAMDSGGVHRHEAKRLRHQPRSAWLSYHTGVRAPLPPAARVHVPDSEAAGEFGMVYLCGERSEPAVDYAIVVVRQWGTEGGLEVQGTLQDDLAALHGALLFDARGALAGSAWPCGGDRWIAQSFS